GWSRNPSSHVGCVCCKLTWLRTSTSWRKRCRSASRPDMPKIIHEIRDPIHVFVRLDSDEREVLNSRPFQRLRHIHQLALTYLVYPGATHKRFEHSLGVMELAGRVFDIITDNATDAIRARLEPLNNQDERRNCS